MPAEQSGEGSINVEEFANLMAEFGWNLRKHQDRNLPCAVCGKDKKGNNKVHGVDLLFTIPCPYSNGRLRGIYVDGKRWKFSSVTSKAAVRNWLTEAREHTTHLDRSQHLFRDQLGLPQELEIDTGLVAWDCIEGWDEEVARQRKSEVQFSFLDRKPLTLNLLYKNQLDRLATVKNLKEKCKEFSFLYVVDGCGVWSNVLTPELIMSNWWAVKYLRGGASEATAIICHDLKRDDEIRFLLPTLSHLQLTPNQKFEVMLPDAGANRTVEIQALLKSAQEGTSFKNLSFVCKNLPFCEYKS